MEKLQEFKRDFFDDQRRLTSIGTGSIGGKASGLVSITRMLASGGSPEPTGRLPVSVPAFSVIGTDVFDAFLERNALREIASSDAPGDAVALAFQRANMPAETVGDLRGLIEKVHTPLAVRSSSLLEDALYQPFAGIYGTKMIPNNQPSTDVRFQKLIEAIKFVYASAFSRSAKDYIKAVGREPQEEKMAVIIQEIIGSRHRDRFYPVISGVARSYDFYSMGRAKPEDGVVSLALGLGKTIVDGGKCWTYSPRYPSISPPFSSAGQLLEQTQTEFWAVNMGKPPAYDPIRETEYMVLASLQDAESDSTLEYVASTYDPQSEKVSMSPYGNGPRILNFPRILLLKDIPVNNAVKSLLEMSEKSLQTPVEIEFAVTFDPPRLGFLQLRPMVRSREAVEITDGEMNGGRLLLASDRVLGNGIVRTISDIVYVKPGQFEARFSPQVASELELMNRKLLETGRQYLLIGFGRWGSSDPWLGIPVNWGQVCGAKVIVEATTPSMNVELSQGSHFFHNLTSFEVSYFSAAHTGDYQINWGWLDQQPCAEETRYLRRIRLQAPLTVKVDGKTSRGIISFE